MQLCMSVNDNSFVVLFMMAIKDFLQLYFICCSCCLWQLSLFGRDVVVLKRICICRILKPVVSLPVFVVLPRPSLDAGDILPSGCPSVFLSV